MKKVIFTIITLLVFQFANANNITVANVSINGQNTASHFSLVNFDVTWENSWRTSTNESNYDGAWVFVKFRKKNAFAWQHATMNYGTAGAAAASGHTEPAGSTVKTAADGKGVWVYRNANGAGNVNFAGAKLRWNYGVDGVADNDSVEVVVYAVEVVYVPQGNFLLGSNGTEAFRLRRGDKDTCFNVTSEGSITVGAASTHLSCSNANYLPTGTIAATYPKGFAAFWVMKYEISQQQYDDFLNSIDYANAVARNPGYFTGTHPALVAPQPERAASQLSQNDVYTFLDWSAMRPMSEFEYEKACRGSNQAPIPDEYPWGNTTITQIATPTDVGLSTEIWATGNGNYNNTLQPMRCGALATSTSNRAQSGATFYGIMEMGGNISEVVVNALGDGRTYTGQHGDGNISNIGSYDVVDWPGLASGLGYKGSSYNVGSPVYLRTSDRSEISVNISRANGYGGRGVRKGE